MKNFTADLGTFSSMSVAELSNGLKRKQFSSVEITTDFLNRIESVNSDLNAFITITAEIALKMAEESDKLRISGEELPRLAGIPCGIKDNICTKGIKTTCGSLFLEDFVPPYDAFVSEILKKSYSPLLGKLNLDEFGMGSTTENSYFGATKNPHNTMKTAGGSSGGSAAAVASGCVPFALGSDTGGSVRQPAAFCGIVGMKPSYGRISRNGLVAFASSFDQIGVLTKTVKDNAIILSELAIHDKNDATSLDILNENFDSELEIGVKGLKIGVPTEFFDEATDSEVKEIAISALETYKKLGAEVVEVSIPQLKHAIHAYYIISSAEASSNLARFDGVRYGRRADDFADITELYKKSRSEGFGREVKRRIMTGTYVLSEGQKDKYYQKALEMCGFLKDSLDDIFRKVDVLLTPTTPTAAFDLGSKLSPVQMYLNDIFTVPANLAGLPAISVPCGKTSENLPVGVQILGKKLDEKTLYRAAFALEQEVNR